MEQNPIIIDSAEKPVFIHFCPAFAAGYLIGLGYPIQDQPENASRTFYPQHEYLLLRAVPILEFELADIAK